MTIDSIKASLQKLHAELESSGPVDAELKALLQTLDSDIQQLLEKNPTETPAATVTAVAPEAEIRSELVMRAQEISARLAANHPLLEAVLRDISRRLADMGI
ncbi:DUF4404 family protein [Paraherbaspirillum soli]|uniref:DUF4404 family protein n=1 Tax=Paraherbaspirillum soli TaxID=631222 RepID=A0ABW0M4V7_9BURK